MSAPLVSVVIPAYNRTGTLPRAIDSVFAQTHPNIELIVVDDASTDGTAALLASYGDRLRVLTHPTNRGAAGARNTGAQAAQGEYLAFLDSDDAWMPEKLTLQLQHMAQQPQIPICFSGAYIHQKKPILRCARNPYNSWLEALLRGEPFCPGSTMLMKTQLFREIGPQDETMRRLEDTDWLIRYFSQQDAAIVVPDPLAHIYPSNTPSSLNVLAATDEIYGRYRDRLTAPRSRTILTLWKCVEESLAYWQQADRKRAGMTLARFSLRHPLFAPYLAQRIARRYLRLFATE